MNYINTVIIPYESLYTGVKKGKKVKSSKNDVKLVISEDTYE